MLKLRKLNHRVIKMDCVCHLSKNNLFDVFRRILISQTVDKRLASKKNRKEKLTMTASRSR